MANRFESLAEEAKAPTKINRFEQMSAANERFAALAAAREDPESTGGGYVGPYADIKRSITEIPTNLKIGFYGSAASIADAVKRRAMESGMILAEATGVGTAEDIQKVLEPQAPGSLMPEEGRFAKGPDDELPFEREPLAPWMERGFQEYQQSPKAMRDAAFLTALRAPDAASKYIRGLQAIDAGKQDKLLYKQSPLARFSRAVWQGGAPSMITAVGVGLLTGDAGMSLALLGEMTGGERFQRELTKGTNPWAASAYATIDEAIEVGTEMMVFPEIFKGVKKGIPLRELLAIVGENAKQETIAALGQGFTERFSNAVLEGKDLDQAIKAAAEILTTWEGIGELTEAAGVGGAMGTVAGIQTVAVERSEKAKELQKVKDAIVKWQEEQMAAQEEAYVKEAEKAAMKEGEAAAGVEGPTEEQAAKLEEKGYPEDKVDDMPADQAVALAEAEAEVEQDTLSREEVQELVDLGWKKADVLKIPEGQRKVVLEAAREAAPTVEAPEAPTAPEAAQAPTEEAVTEPLTPEKQAEILAEMELDEEILPELEAAAQPPAQKVAPTSPELTQVEPTSPATTQMQEAGWKVEPAQPAPETQTQVDETLKALGSEAKVEYATGEHMQGVNARTSGDTIIIRSDLTTEEAVREVVAHEVAHQIQLDKDVAKVMSPELMARYAAQFREATGKTKEGKALLKLMDEAQIQREAASMMIGEMLADTATWDAIMGVDAGMAATLKKAITRAKKKLGPQAKAFAVIESKLKETKKKAAEKKAAKPKEKAAKPKEEEKKPQPAPKPVKYEGGQISGEASQKLDDAVNRFYGTDEQRKASTLKNDDPIFDKKFQAELAQRVIDAINRGDTDAEAAALLTAAAVKDIRAWAKKLARQYTKSGKTEEEIFWHGVQLYNQVVAGQSYLTPKGAKATRLSKLMLQYKPGKGTVSNFLLGRPGPESKKLSASMEGFAKTGKIGVDSKGRTVISVEGTKDATPMEEISTDDTVKKQNSPVAQQVLETVLDVVEKSGLEIPEMVAEVNRRLDNDPVLSLLGLELDEAALRNYVVNKGGQTMPRKAADFSKSRFATRLMDLFKPKNMKARPKTVGTPQRANISPDEFERRALDLVDEIRAEQGLPEQQTRKEIEARALQMKSDTKSVEKVRGKLAMGIALTPEENALAVMLIRDAWDTYIQNRQDADLTGWRRLAEGLRRSRADIATALAMGVDKFKTKAERLAEFAMQSVALPDRELRKKIDALQTKLDNLTQRGVDTANIEKTVEEIRQLEEQWTAKQKEMMQTFEEDLARKGLTLADVSSDAIRNDMNTALKVIRSANQATPSRSRDKIYEFWVSNAISAIKTALTNLGGNSGYLAVDAMLVRPISAAINEQIYKKTGKYVEGAPRRKSGKALTEREQTAMKKYLQKKYSSSFWHMFDSFWEAMKSEMPTFTMKSDGALTAQSIATWETSRNAIKTKGLGRAIRGAGTALMAVDQAFMAGIVRARLYDYAMIEAMEMGLTEIGEITEYVEQQVRDTTSKAWVTAMDDAKHLTFKEELGAFGQKGMEVRSSIHQSWFGKIPHPLDPQYFASFAPVMTNLFKTGLEFVPGWIPAWRQFMKAVSPEQRAQMEADGFDKAALRRVSKQIIGTFITLAVWAMTDDEDEDGNPKMPIFIPGSEFGRAETENRSMEYPDRNPGTIQVAPGMRLNLDRLDPLAISISVIGNIAVEARRAKKDGQYVKHFGKALRRLSRLSENKTPMGGIERVLASISNPDRAAGYLISDFYGSALIHNIIRQPQREADEFYRETSVRYRDPGVSPREVKQYVDRMWRAAFPYRNRELMPKVDAFGMEQYREGPTWFRVVVPSKAVYAKDPVAQGWRLLAIDWNRRNPKSLHVPLGEWKRSTMGFQYTLENNVRGTYRPDDKTIHAMRLVAGEKVAAIMARYGVPEGRLDEIQAGIVREEILAARQETRDLFKTSMLADIQVEMLEHQKRIEEQQATR